MMALATLLVGFLTSVIIGEFPSTQVLLFSILAAWLGFQKINGRRRYVFPLADLAAVGEDSPNAQPVQDYRVWFANR